MVVIKYITIEEDYVWQKDVIQQRRYLDGWVIFPER